MGHTKVTVERLPKCDFCGRIARYNSRVKSGIEAHLVFEARYGWAYMCEACFAIYGVGLGLGKGQELILASIGGLELDTGFDIDKALDEISYKLGGINE